VGAGGILLGFLSVGLLDPGETFSNSVTAGPLQNPGNYNYLTFMVDWNQVVNESDETNNTAATPLNGA
jgi:subtilase family serine protease